MGEQSKETDLEACSDRQSWGKDAGLPGHLLCSLPLLPRARVTSGSGTKRLPDQFPTTSDPGNATGVWDMVSLGDLHV